MKHASNSVRLKSNGGYWQACWSVAGQTKAKSLGSKQKVSKRAALALCKDIEREHMMNPGRMIAGQSPTLDAWTARYIELRTDIEEGTMDMHKVTIAYLTDQLGAGRRLDKITRLDAAAFRQWMTTKQGASNILIGDKKERVSISDASVCRHIRNAKTIFEKAKELDIVALNPFDRERGTPQAIEKDWKELDEKIIAQLIDRSPNAEWKRLFALCAYAGLRRGEALRLKWSDIDLTKRRLTVRTKAGKVNTKQKVREVFIAPELQTIIEERATTSHPLLVANVPEHNIERDCAVVMKAAGLEAWSPPFHTLRKWRADSWRTNFPEHVVDSWLGHSLQVARKNYTRVAESYYGDPKPNVHALAASLKALSPDQLAAILQTITPTTKAQTAQAG